MVLPVETLPVQKKALYVPTLEEIANGNTKSKFSLAAQTFCLQFSTTAQNCKKTLKM